ncbi:hypothetical protein D3C75_833040 [compost metagenome]
MAGQHAEQSDAGDGAQQQCGQGWAQGLVAIGAQVGQVGAEEGSQAEHEQVGGDCQQDVAEYRECQAEGDPAAIRCGGSTAQPGDQGQYRERFGQQGEQGVVAGQCIYIEGGGDQGENHQVAWTKHGWSLRLCCLKHRPDPRFCFLLYRPFRG